MTVLSQPTTMCTSKNSMGPGAGKAIAAIFADDGEAGFRDLESEVVAQLCGRERVVIALGGGAVLRESNRPAIASSSEGAQIVFLDTPGIHKGDTRMNKQMMEEVEEALQVVDAAVQNLWNNRHPRYASAVALSPKT